jgi:hypothetical protein
VSFYDDDISPFLSSLIFFSVHTVQALENKVREVNEEVKVLSNKKNVTADPLEDKLALFRQQVDIPLPHHF